MTARANSIKKKIQSIDFAISLLEKERRLLRKDLYVEKWENNPFAHDKQMRKTAEFFYDLNYFIFDVNKAEPNSDNFEYNLAKKIWSCYPIGKPFVKELCEAKDPFVYRLESEEKSTLIMLCQAMSTQGWLEFTPFKTGVEIIPKLTGSNKCFLKGVWMESANRYLINKTLHSFANEKKVKSCNVFWNVKLKEIGSEENASCDMELDIVVELDGRFYIFETKSGAIDFKKMTKMANLFDTEKSRFILCNSDENQSSKLYSPTHLLIPLPQLEKQLKDILTKDFPNESIMTA